MLCEQKPGATATNAPRWTIYTPQSLAVRLADAYNEYSVRGKVAMWGHPAAAVSFCGGKTGWS